LNEVVGTVNVEGRQLKLVKLPPPQRENLKSWDNVRETLLTWRPRVEAEVVDLNGLACPIVGDELFLVDELTSLVLREIFSLFYPSPPPEISASTAIGNVVGEIERTEGRSLTTEERVFLTLQLVERLSLLVDLGVLR